MPHEIHPDTPEEGRLMTDLFSQVDVDGVLEACRQHGAKYGIQFRDMEMLRNTRKALAAAEFARDHGKYDDFHHAVFKAYFNHGRDIGSVDTLMDIASSCGLDAKVMVTSLESGIYLERLAEGSAKARSMGVRAIPAFFIEDQPAITGAVAEARFRDILDRMLQA
ncbi:DSBA-like thioredoxin domain protein (fragment) [Pseudodesulfovibrio profundus]|uniref:DSBA-like thioredoxin domain protein n=1 Tax=Pseudodesulfovibrio profundus TaxID=57320 RepID=A0A2C8F939_9BACT